MRPSSQHICIRVMCYAVEKANRLNKTQIYGSHFDLSTVVNIDYKGMYEVLFKTCNDASTFEGLTNDHIYNLVTDIQ